MNTEDSEFERIEREQAMRNVPDPIHHTDTSESLEYITGWNDCRQVILAEQPAQQEPIAFVPKEALDILSGGFSHVPATLTLNDDGGKSVALYTKSASTQTAGKSELEVVPTKGGLMAEQPAPAAPEEPCGWQYFHLGKWHNGMETDGHRAITKAAGVPIRDVYPSPQAQPAPKENNT